MKINMSDLTGKRGAFTKLIEQKHLELTAKVAVDVHAAVVLATPVDTGKARGAWTVETPTQPFQNAKIENNVEYIVELDKGHSDQAPTGIVANAIEAATRL